jgi:hypothetical protein
MGINGIEKLRSEACIVVIQTGGNATGEHRNRLDEALDMRIVATLVRQAKPGSDTRIAIGEFPATNLQRR